MKTTPDNSLLGKEPANEAFTLIRRSPQHSLDQESFRPQNSRATRLVSPTAEEITESFIANGSLSLLPFDKQRLLVRALAGTREEELLLVEDLRCREENNNRELRPILKLAELALDSPRVFAVLVTSGVMRSN